MLGKKTLVNNLYFSENYENGKNESGIDSAILGVPLKHVAHINGKLLVFLCGMAMLGLTVPGRSMCKFSDS